MDGGGVLLGLLAGVLSTLSPCVLPLLPLVLGGAAAGGAWLLAAAGVALSFTGIGLFVATVGFAAGLDGSVFRTVSAVLLGLMGVVLLSAGLQGRFALAAGGVSGAGDRLIDRWAPRGRVGALVTGGLLGAVWAPCVGPTLGAASLLAAQRQSLPAVAAVMFAFGLGAAAPLVLVAQLSRQAMQRWRGRLLGAGQAGKRVFGGLALLTATLILSGADRSVEGWAVSHSPPWLTALTTRF